MQQEEEKLIVAENIVEAPFSNTNDSAEEIKTTFVGELNEKLFEQSSELQSLEDKVSNTEQAVGENPVVEFDDEERVNLVQNINQNIWFQLSKNEKMSKFFKKLSYSLGKLNREKKTPSSKQAYWGVRVLEEAMKQDLLPSETKPLIKDFLEKAS